MNHNKAKQSVAASTGYKTYQERFWFYLIRLTPNPPLKMRCKMLLWLINTEVCALLCHQTQYSVSCYSGSHITAHSVLSLASGSAFFSLCHLTLQSCCVPWDLLHSPRVCIAVAACFFFFFLVKDVAKSTLPLSVLTSTVWTPAYYFFVQWEGQPLAHPHSKVTRLGGMSETASYNTMMQDPVWCSGQKQLCVCVCVCVLHHCSPFVMSLPVLWNTEGSLR